MAAPETAQQKLHAEELATNIHNNADNALEHPKTKGGALHALQSEANQLRGLSTRQQGSVRTDLSQMNAPGLPHVTIDNLGDIQAAGLQTVKPHEQTSGGGGLFGSILNAVDGTDVVHAVKAIAHGAVAVGKAIAHHPMEIALDSLVPGAAAIDGISRLTGTSSALDHDLTSVADRVRHDAAAVECNPIVDGVEVGAGVLAVTALTMGMGDGVLAGLAVMGESDAEMGGLAGGIGIFTTGTSGSIAGFGAQSAIRNERNETIYNDHHPNQSDGQTK